PDDVERFRSWRCRAWSFDYLEDKGPGALIGGGIDLVVALPGDLVDDLGVWITTAIVIGGQHVAAGVLQDQKRVEADADRVEGERVAAPRRQLYVVNLGVHLLGQSAILDERVRVIDQPLNGQTVL